MQCFLHCGDRLFQVGKGQITFIFIFINTVIIHIRKICNRDFTAIVAQDKATLMCEYIFNQFKEKYQKILKRNSRDGTSKSPNNIQLNEVQKR